MFSRQRPPCAKGESLPERDCGTFVGFRLPLPFLKLPTTWFCALPASMEMQKDPCCKAAFLFERGSVHFRMQWEGSHECERSLVLQLSDGHSFSQAPKDSLIFPCLSEVTSLPVADAGRNEQLWYHRWEPHNYQECCARARRAKRPLLLWGPSKVYGTPK